MPRRSRPPEARPRGGAPPRFECADEGYRRWATIEVAARGRALRMATKPGLLSSDALDPAAALLLDHLEIAPTDRVVDLHAGSGVVGAFAALAAPEGSVRMADRSVLSVEASRRTLALNGVSNAELLLSQGVSRLPGEPADLAIVRLPSAKVPTLHLLHDAHRLLRTGGRCYLAGANDEGIRTALREMEEIFGNQTLLGYRGGHRVGVSVREDGAGAGVPWLDPDRFHELTVETRGGEYRVHSRPGVFSWDRLDRGSEALIEAMEVGAEDEVLEIGCGYGIVGVAAARLGERARVTMVDVDVEAVRSAFRTAEANGVADRCEVLPSDVASAVLDRRFDLVLANPPFHVGKATNLDVPAQFIRDAAGVLRPGGRLFLVANRTLPYERWVEGCFGAVRTVVDGREFKVLGATKPG